MDRSGQLSEGLSRHRAGRFGDAVEIYRQLLATTPNDGDVLYLLGAALHQSGANADALPVIRRAVTATPERSACLNVLGLVLSALGNDTEAVSSFRRAIAIDGSPEAQENLEALLNRCCDKGDEHERAGRLVEAMAAYGTALKLDEGLARAWYAIGSIHGRRKDYALAQECFRRALKRVPDWAEAQHNLAQSLFELGQVDDALQRFARASEGAHPEMPLAMIAVTIPGSPSAGNQTILAARRNWASRYHKRLSLKGALTRPGGRRPRIGYVSAFFARDNWMKPVWTLINHHNRERFEIHLFSDGPVASIRHGYCGDERDVFHDIRQLSNEEAAELMRRADIDIAVDLNGFSKMSRIGLFALRPAPLVAAWFNTYATTGSECYDYLIGDAEVIPEKEESFYTERILRVPGSYLTFEINYPVPQIEARMPGNPFTFGCLAPQYKITNEVITTWSEILRRTPGTRLILKNSVLRSRRNREFVIGKFSECGVEPARLILEEPAQHYAFLQTYARMDVALDTFPYNGGTTTTEAIWQGVPVLAIWGDRWVSRTSASILRNAGLGELVCESIPEYIEAAVHLADAEQSGGKLRELRREMRAKLRASPVCNGASFAENMESLYASMLESRSIGR